MAFDVSTQPVRGSAAIRKRLRRTLIGAQLTVPINISHWADRLIHQFAIDRGGRFNVGFTAQEKADLIAFLKSL